MGARLPWEQEVLGSTPRRPTDCDDGSRGLVAQTRLISALRCVRFAGLPLTHRKPNHVPSLEMHAANPSSSAPWCQWINILAF